MTYQSAYTMLNAISPNIPVNYYQWPENEAPELPYILFYYPTRDDFIADGKNYAKITQLNIELYTKNKDFATEAMVEAKLEEYGLVYTKEEQYINEEHMYEVLYITNITLED